MPDEEEKIEKKSISEKYKTHGNLDPYPEVEPSLLNSADIFDYVEKTGMIDPFYPENLKPSSYGIKPKGEFIYWESTIDKKSGKIENITEKDEDGDFVFTLKSNTIAYVQLEPHFRLPSYIAARFNLKIKHIYQGILLGTGPLVDPGYEGCIYFPLHNLTNNDYKIKIDKPIIWMEFTKLSTNDEWDREYKKSSERRGNYVPFDKKRLKEKMTLSEYINDAHPNAPILSTISGFFERTNRSIDDFERRITQTDRTVLAATDGANRATTQFNRAIIIAIIAVVVTISITIFQTVTIHNKTIDYLKEYDKRITEEHIKYINEKTESIDLKRDINNLENKLLDQQRDIEKLKKK